MAAMGLASADASAAGCLKGAVVGGVAGHMACKHAVLGAAGGCVVGSHMEGKKEREQAAGRADKNQSPTAPSVPAAEAAAPAK